MENALLKDVRLGDIIFCGAWLLMLMLALALFVVLEFRPLTLWLPGFKR